jgi:hypothetical protein
MKHKILIITVFLILFSSQLYSQSGAISPTWTTNIISASTNLIAPSDITTDARGFVYVTATSQFGPYDANIITSKLSPSGDTLWMREYTSTSGYRDEPVKILVDTSGNVYVGGMVRVAQYDPNWALIKYNQNGQLLWVDTLTSDLVGSSADIVYDMEFDYQGNIILAGSMSANGTVAGYPAWTMAKIAPNGQKLWRNQTPVDYANNNIYKIAVDMDNNIYATGDEGHGSILGSQCITRKYNPNGVIQWQREYNFIDSTNTGSYDAGVDIEVDDCGGIYVISNSNVNLANTDRDYIVIKYNVNGLTTWLSRYSSAANGGNDQPVDLQIGTLREVYVTGITRPDMGSPDADITTVKFSAGGSFEWGRTYTNPQLSAGTDVPIKIIGTMLPENIYVLGKSQGNNYDAILLKYSMSGDLQWKKRYDGTGPSGAENPLGIALDNNFNVFIVSSERTGQFDYTQVVKFAESDVTVTVPVSGPGTYPLSSGSSTTGAEVTLSSVTGPGSITGSFYKNLPALLSFADTIPQYRSSYRWVIEQAALGNISGIISFILSQIPVANHGISNPNTAAIYKRAIDGIGAFTKLVTTFSNGRLSAPITGFSEFIIASNTDPILVKNEEANIPDKFKLSQNFPNPFNPATRIDFSIPKLSNVRLSVYDITGKEVALLVNQKLDNGSYYYQFNGEKLSNGMYFYKLTAGDFSETKKMILVK